MIGQRTKKRLLTAGLLTCAMGFGMLAGGEARAQGQMMEEPRFGTAQDPHGGDMRSNPLVLPRQQPIDSSRQGDLGGTGGSGDTGTLPRDESTLDPAAGNNRNQGTTGMTQEPGTGRVDTNENKGTFDETGTGGSGTRGASEGMVNEPGTGGTGSAGDGSVRNSNEGVLTPGVDDEGLDKDQGQADQDTVYQGTTQPRPD